MKNTFTYIQAAFILVISFLISTKGLSQAPASIPYQAVARDNAGNFLANQAISLRFSIRNGTPTGTIVYQETHSDTTNILGLFTVDIGQGIPVIGSLSGINWANGAKFLEVELDTAGGSSFVSMGTTQLNSVPYALFSAKSGNLNDGSAAGNTPYWNGTAWVTNNSNIFNNGGNVGVGTTTPAAKLDVNGNTKVDGTIRTSKTAPIGQQGSSVWVGGNDNGNLFAPGTPELGIRIFNNSLAPGQSTIQAWNYQTNTARDIIMNDAGGRVGIGTASPSAKLDVAGTVKIADGTQGAGKVLTSDATGLATWTTPMTLPTGVSSGNTVRWNGTAWVSDSLLTNTGVRVGIGTTTPQERLHIKSGNMVLEEGSQRFFASGAPRWDIFGDTAGYTISRSGIDFPFYISRNTGNIGVGTTTPAAKLDVAGTVKIADGTQGAGKVLTSDANGVATWITPSGLPAGSAAGNTPYWNGTAWVTNNSNVFNNGGNVGVGTTTPTAKLEVAGTANLNGNTKVDGTIRTSKTAPIGQQGSSVWVGGNDNGNLFAPGTPELGIRIFNNSVSPGQSTIQAWNYQTNTARDIIMNDAGGRVGIGTASPTAKLDVAGTVKIADGTQGAGKVLTSDATGLATWTTPMTLPTGVSSGNTVRWNGTAWVSDSLLTNTGVRVGIGTTTPQERLHIKSGNMVLEEGSQRFFASGAPRWDIFGDTAGYTISRSGIDFPFYISRNTGNIGVGTTTPAAKLEVAGTANLNGNTKVDGTIRTSKTAPIGQQGSSVWVGGNDNGNLFAPGTPELGIRIFNNSVSPGQSTIQAWNYQTNTARDIIMNDAGGRVGIGTASPSAKLDVAGTVKIADGTQGAGKVLTSDATGLATWTTPMTLPTGVSSGNTVRWNGTAWVSDSLLTNTGVRVGIGTTTPQERLHIKSGNMVLEEGSQRFFASGAPRWDIFGDTAGYTISRSGIDFPFYISRNTGNIGVGTTTPAAKLDVAGTVKIADGTQGAGKVLTSDATGLATWTTPMTLPTGVSSGNTVRWNGTAWVSDSLLTNTGVRVGIGTTTPQERLHIKSGNMVLEEGSQRFFASGAPRWDIFGDTAGYTISRSGIDFPFYISRNTGNIGVGTTTPAAKLDVAGTVKIADGTQGAGKVLTSDANGVATWTTPSGLPAGSAAGNTPYWNGTAWVTNNSNVFNNGGNVGVGTTTPTAKLEVAGTANLNGNTKVDGMLRTSKTAPIGQQGSSVWVGGNDNGNLFAPGTPELGIRIFNNSVSPGQSTIQAWNYQTNTARDIIMNDAGGRVGIGTASPAFTFDVTTSRSGSFAARIYNSGNTTTSTALLVRGGDANGSSGTLLQTFQSGNGTTYGSISFTGTGISYNTTSDQRLKKNITDTKLGINVLRKIQIKDYQYINRGDEIIQGFLAQQLYEVYPQAVSKGTDEKDENGQFINPWMVDYSKLTPLLIKSVQEQQDQIEALKAENAKLVQQVEAILKALQKN